MGWFILSQVLTILISIVRIGRMSEQEKDLEILILRQQLAILQRKQGLCFSDLLCIITLSIELLSPQCS
jgi:hypothetical protein